MAESVFSTEERPRRKPGGRHGRSGLALAALALGALLVLLPLVYQWVHRESIFPGVRVAGVPIGGRSAAAAIDRLADVGLDPEAPVTFRVGGETFSLEPAASGLAFDARATVEEAWAVGRRGSRPQAVWEMLAARFRQRPVAPIVRLDQAKARAALQDIATRFDRPAQNAAVAVEGTEVRTTPASSGRALDLEASLARLTTAAAAGVWPVRELDLASTTLEPEVTDASAAVAAAESLLAEPLTVQVEDQLFPLEPAVLAPMLTTKVEADAVKLDLNRDAFRGWMLPATVAISHTTELPRFHYDVETGGLVLVKPGREGKAIDFEETAARLLEAGASGERLVRAGIEVVPPEVADTVTAAELGIHELIRSDTSRFSGSTPERIHNVALAASQYDGLLVPPDAVFSFNEHLGDVSFETGYKKTLIIMDGATRDGVGGGVCQVSTTLFRTAFWAGLPIVDRTAHGYRVAYYEQGAPVGFDATIYSPVVDFKFKNDTGAWLLIETATNTRAATTTFRFYGTKPNREVAMEGPVTSKAVPPPAARTELDPSLAPGQTKIVEHARSGASVALTRVIREPGKEEVREVFRSHYVPTGQVTAVGPAAPASEVADPGTTQTADNSAGAPSGGSPPPP